MWASIVIVWYIRISAVQRQCTCTDGELIYMCEWCDAASALQRHVIIASVHWTQSSTAQPFPESLSGISAFGVLLVALQSQDPLLKAQRLL